MNRTIYLASLLILSVACSPSSVTELARQTSPDGAAMAVITTKAKTGIPLPGPEPPKTKAKWARLTISADGKQLYDSGFEDVGIFQSIPFAFDLAWSPDSEHLAYRSITSLRIVSKAGKCETFEVVKDNSLISSFRWTGNRELLVVTKRVDDPLGMFGYPQHYHAYTTEATNVRVVRVSLDSGVTERFIQDVKNPTFMFHSVGFQNREISEHSNRVAFSDGSAICIYDDSLGRVIACVPVGGPIEGTWWDTDDRVIIGIGLLSGSVLGFAALDVPGAKVEDQTSRLRPLWDRKWENVDWFRAGAK